MQVEDNHDIGRWETLRGDRDRLIEMKTTGGLRQLTDLQILRTSLTDPCSSCVRQSPQAPPGILSSFLSNLWVSGGDPLLTHSYSWEERQL